MSYNTASSPPPETTERMTDQRFNQIADPLRTTLGDIQPLVAEARRARESEAAKDAEIAVLKMQLQGLGNEICALHKTEALLLRERDRLREALDEILAQTSKGDWHRYGSREWVAGRAAAALAGGGEK